MKMIFLFFYLLNSEPQTITSNAFENCIISIHGHSADECHEYVVESTIVIDIDKKKINITNDVQNFQYGIIKKTDDTHYQLASAEGLIFLMEVNTENIKIYNERNIYTFQTKK